MADAAGGSRAGRGRIYRLGAVVRAVWSPRKVTDRRMARPVGSEGSRIC